MGVNLTSNIPLQPQTISQATEAVAPQKVGVQVDAGVSVAATSVSEELIFELGGTASAPATPDLATGKQVGAALAQSVANLAQLAGAVGAEKAALGDVEFQVPSKFIGFDPQSIASSLANLGKSFGSLGDLEFERAPGFITGFLDAGRLAQAEVAVELFRSDYGALQSKFGKIIGKLLSAPKEQAAKQFGGFVESLGSRGADGLPRDVNALVQWVLRESYLESCKDLEDHANKVKFYNNVKKKIRAELERARGTAARMAGKDDSAVLEGGAFIPSSINMDPSSALGDPAAAAKPHDAAAAKAAHEAALKEQERQAKIDEWNAKPPKEVGSSKINPGRKSYGGSSDYGKFDQYANWFSAEMLAQVNAMSEEQKAALMEQIVADGGITFSFSCYETDKKNNHYSHSRKIAPRPGESLDEYMARAAKEVATEFKDKVKGTEGAINIQWIQGSCSLPAYSYKEPLPPELGGTSGALTGGEWKKGDPIVSKADLDAYITSLEEDLSSVGDDAQLANVDLQNALQKQQQVMQQMSNISKMLHDTAMAIIRKIGG